MSFCLHTAGGVGYESQRKHGFTETYRVLFTFHKGVFCGIWQGVQLFRLWPQFILALLGGVYTVSVPFFRMIPCFLLHTCGIRVVSPERFLRARKCFYLRVKLRDCFFRRYNMTRRHMVRISARVVHLCYIGRLRTNQRYNPAAAPGMSAPHTIHTPMIRPPGSIPRHTQHTPTRSRLDVQPPTLKAVQHPRSHTIRPTVSGPAGPHDDVHERSVTNSPAQNTRLSHSISLTQRRWKSCCPGRGSPPDSTKARPTIKPDRLFLLHDGAGHRPAGMFNGCSH